ncbi:TetR/AcrR family transcriptional regulator [Bradyrhizobium sp. CCBAU 45384]|uniref:TetR/AcrR family transcriptional regulator n=1 Tax=Bradyrhizobium sp. CCBAU 45384 TaxID=858428 RepID=UPI002305603E|nr:TetR/AcrR family transcriptional regulator [Bradyrhizobium sp. CCBAU 45384]MDA9406164.1 TetR family transcriptional regulator [Bradyrhizobium sp. CCBAU 45384]
MKTNVGSTKVAGAGRKRRAAPSEPAFSSSAARYASASSVAILDAARTLFLQRGFDGVNLDQVAKAAGTSRQTVYNQFGSKDAVFREVVRRHWATIRTETESVFQSTSDPDDDAGAMLARFAEALLRFVDETDQIAFTRLVIAESRRLPWIAAEFYRAGKEPVLKTFAKALAAMTKKGRLSCKDPELAAHQFMGLVQEFIIWPKVMAIGEGLRDLPPNKLVVGEAITMFLARYRRS